MTAVAGRRASICTPIRESLRAIGQPGAGGASIEFGSRSTNAEPARKTRPVIGFILALAIGFLVGRTDPESQFLGFACRVSAWARRSS